MKYYKQLFSPLNQNSVNIAKNTLALFYDCKSQQSTNISYSQVFLQGRLSTCLQMGIKTQIIT